MNKDLLQVELLDRVQHSIEENICSYEIEEIEDIFEELQEEIFEEFLGIWIFDREVNII